MNIKKIIAVGIAVSVIGVGVVGAQQDGPGRPGEPGGRRGFLGRHGLDGSVVTIITDATGLTPMEIMAEIRGGSTLAEVITEQGGDVSAVANDVIADVTESVNEAVTNGRLTQERADEILTNLPDRVNEILNGEFQGMPHGGEGRPGVARFMGRQVLLDAVIDATGLDRADIREQHRAGATLSEIVTENGGDVNAVIAAAVASVSERAAEAVENGRLTQEQADELIAQATEFFTNAMNGVRPGAAV